MKESIRNSWVVLALSFTFLIYNISTATSPEWDDSLTQWVAMLASTMCCVILIYGSVKSLMHEMNNAQELPEDKAEADE